MNRKLIDDESGNSNSLLLKTGQRAELESVSCGICSSSDFDKVWEAGDTRFGLTDARFTVVKCLKCGMHYTNPRPTVETLGSFYPGDYYSIFISNEPTQSDHKGTSFGNRYAAWQSRRSKATAADERVKITRKTAKTPGRLLDIGCAAGNYLIAMGPYGWQVTGVDMDEAMCQFARDTRGLEMIHGTLESVELPEAEFDLVTMWESLEHMPDPVGSLKKVVSTLKPGGYLVVSVPDIGSLAARIMKSDWPNLDLPRHLYHFDKNTAFELCRRTGLDPQQWLTSIKICGTGFSTLILQKLGLERPRPKNIVSRAVWRSARESGVAFGALLGQVATIFGQGDNGILIARKPE